MHKRNFYILNLIIITIITLTTPIASAWIAGSGTGGGGVALRHSYTYSDTLDQTITIKYNPPSYGYPYNHSLTWQWDGKAIVAMHVYRLYNTFYIGATPITMETKLSADIVGKTGGPYYYSVGSYPYLREYYTYYYITFNNRDAYLSYWYDLYTFTQTFCVEASTAEEAKSQIESGLSEIFVIVYSISYGTITQEGTTWCIETTWSTKLYKYTVTLLANGYMTEEIDEFFNGEQVGSTIATKEFGYDDKGNPITYYVMFYSKYNPSSVCEGWGSCTNG